ncbi:MAG: capsid cement protein [Cypionkella sp.]
MKNFVQAGSALTIPAAVASGDVDLMGNIIGIANATAAASGADLDVTTTGVFTLAASADVAVALLMGDMGTADPDFFNGLVDGIARFETGGDQFQSKMANFLVSVARAVQPKDELEALFAVQMGAVHASTMRMARILNRSQTIQQQDAAERALNKLTRTYAAQMEALKRYRSL